MSQRRKVAPSSNGDGLIKEEVLNASIEAHALALDSGGDDDSEDDEALPLAERVDRERHRERLRCWQESAFAAGLVEPTWMDERKNHLASRRPLRYGDDEMMPDSTGCLCCSSLICPLLGAGRVGNMVVLHSTTEVVEEVEQDEETGEEIVQVTTRPKLDIVMGPYWPMLVFVTYPLILIVSFFAFRQVILPGDKPPVLVFVWTVFTVGLMVSLALTACRDPGVMYRFHKPPPQYENSWRWNEQAQTWRPRNAFFDSDAGVVVREFDHTCPWTGTAIGQGNMLPFQFFVCLVFVCLIMDIFIITGTMV